MATKGADTNKAYAAQINGDTSNANYQVYNGTNTHIGVGDSSADESTSHTDLQAATNKVRTVCDSRTVTNATNVIVVTLADGVAQFAHNELAKFNGSTGKTMAWRDITGWGTKNAGETWIYTITETYAG